MNKYKVIAICGKSAAGKDTFLKKLMVASRQKAHEIISYTSRPPREEELDGYNYNFISKEQFINKIENGEMLEFAQYRDWYYGTALDALDSNRINIGVFNRKGIESLLSHDEIDLFIVEMKSSGKTRLLRSLNRETFPDVDEIIRRYQADEEEWEDFNLDTYEVNNDYSIDLELTAQLVWFNACRHWAKETN